jgi:deoxyribonuclease V
LGVLAGVPAIGVAKTLFVGRHAPLASEHGAWEPLLHRGEVVGAAVCTRPGTKPIFVSIGHRISLPTAIEYVLRCTTKYRLPETTRHAHKLASG